MDDRTTNNYNNGNGHWSNFWQFNVGHLLIIIGMVVSAAWWFVTYDREITLTRISVKQLSDTVDKLASKVDRMDDTGTRFSQQGIGRDSEFVKQTMERINKLEPLISQVNMVSYQVNEISTWVKQQRDMYPEIPVKK